MDARRLVSRTGFILVVALGGFPGAPDAGAQTLPISAVVLSKNSCTFRGATPGLSFAGIDPASASPATASVTWTLRCVGSAASSTWVASASNGLHASPSGSRRMRHATSLTEFVAYTLTVPASGIADRNVETPFTISGSISPAAFQNALPGTYSDTVTLTLNP